MAANKEKLIEEFLKTPIQPGQYITISGEGVMSNKKYYVTVHEVKGDTLVVDGEYNRHERQEIPLDRIVSRCTTRIGANPFNESKSHVRMVAYSIESILGACGYDRPSKTIKLETVDAFQIPEVNWNPIVRGPEGERIPYQRDFVWTLKDKQLLIESIYNGIQTGKVILKKNSWDYVKKEASLGYEVGFKDVVDGKQRLKALIDFFSNQFPDLHGNYYADLSTRAQRKFDEYQGLSYGVMDEDSTDEEILETFLTINFTGAPMSEEHIEYVKNIKVK